jgi:hypothetical protein
MQAHAAILGRAWCAEPVVENVACFVHPGCIGNRPRQMEQSRGGRLDTTKATENLEYLFEYLGLFEINIE